jgi:Cu(I)/Ag(I) efflux system membrane fusion protein
MDLIPVSQLADEGAQLETEPVVHRELFKEIRTVGRVDYDESRVAYITARIDGRVDRVFADFTGIQVKQGDHLVSIYSPELYAAQAELLRSLEALQGAQGDRRFLQSNLESARMKLQLLGILPEQIREIEASRRELTHLTIYSPIGGVVIEKSVREQQYVKEGDMMYRIAELNPIWLFLDIYEYDLAWVRYGQKVEVEVEAYPGEVFEGTVVFIDPFLSDQTRTVKVRVNLQNRDYKLKPAMYASARIHVSLRADGTPQATGLEGKYICPMHPEIVQDTSGECSICNMALEQVPDLFPAHPPGDHEAHQSHENAIAGQDTGASKVLAVRKSAVLDTGRRQIAYRKRKDGAYELVELKLGPLAESRDESRRLVNYYPVLDGLHAGDEVVVQGGFLLDSQRQIEGMPSLLYEEGRSAAALHAGHGGGAASATGSPAQATPSAPPISHQH